MSLEFYQEEKKRNFGRYLGWGFLIVAGGVVGFHLFFIGANNIISFVKSASVVYFERSPSQTNTTTTNDNFVVVDTDSNGNIINRINDLSSGEVLGASTSSIKVGEKYGQNLSMFRGNPSRTWYGQGPLPKNMHIIWRYPDKPMCADSTAEGVTKLWCGSGWTGQPLVYERPDGKEEIIFGAYDKNIHFVNAETGVDLRKPFETGDIIKGTGTIDPDGFPLLYIGSRDNKLRIIALDTGDEAKELWNIDATNMPGIWNDDWDGNPVIKDDLLFEGGENGWFFVVKLNRAYDESGQVTVDPEIVFKMPAYDDALIQKVGDDNLSIENSVAMYKNYVYFANSGGRILGLDISHAKDGEAPVIFDFWAGDDIDASIVIDDNGKLYAAVEAERLNERSSEVGQLIKLDPTKNNPLIWSIKIPSTTAGINGGIWATPALYKKNLYVATNPGKLLVVDTGSGEILWQDDIGPHAWSSPIISNDELLVATCSGKMYKYDLTNPDKPEKKDEFNLPSGSCIESTPALFKSSLFFGARDGYFYKVGEK